MSKELTPLEALERIKNHCENDFIRNMLYGYEKELKLIKTALKKLDMYENVVGIERIQDTNKKLKALEIIKETPIFAWYVTIYEDAYEMISDVKGFRTNNSVEELQEMFNLLKEVLL